MITNKVIFYLIIVIWFCIRFPLLLRLYMYSLVSFPNPLVSWGTRLVLLWGDTFDVLLVSCSDFNLHRLSLVTRIIPSPDWFVGIDSLDLCRNGGFVSSVKVTPIEFYSCSHFHKCLLAFTFVVTFTFNSGFVFSVKAMTEQFHSSSHFHIHYH